MRYSTMALLAVRLVDEHIHYLHESYKITYVPLIL